jgi:hypothetical protein
LGIAVDVDEGDLDSAGQDDYEDDEAMDFVADLIFGVLVEAAVHADAAVPNVEVTQASASQKRKAGVIQGVTPVNR